MRYLHLFYRRQLTGILLLACAVGIGFIVTAAPVVTDGSLPSWDEIRPLLEQRSNSVKSLRAVFVMEEFNNRERRTRHIEDERQSQKDSKGSALPLPDDLNRVETYRWITDGVRWRCEKYRAYPNTGDNYDLAMYDGEKYIVYNSYQQMAFVSGGKDKIFPLAATVPSSGPVIRAGDYEQVNTYENAGFQFRPVGKETVNGFECVKFSASKAIPPNTSGDVSFWVDLKQGGLIIKWREKIGLTGNQVRINDFVVTKVKLINNIYVATDVKDEFYAGNNINTNWLFTRHYILREAQLNIPLTTGFFKDVLPVGTSIIDEIESPGSISYIGGDPSLEVKEVRLGIPPKLEEPNVTPDGKLQQTLNP